LEFIYKISDLLMQNLPIEETLEKILDLILELLVRIDRAAFILIDPEAGKVTQLISRLRVQKPPASSDCPIDLVYRVIKEKDALMVSDSQWDGVAKDEIFSAFAQVPQKTELAVFVIIQARPFSFSV
jgi:hypothetical protein